jgi:hypothetical protein
MRSQNFAVSLAPVKDGFTSVFDTSEEFFVGGIDTNEAI